VRKGNAILKHLERNNKEKR